ncbi:MAG: hypothetical protein ACLQPH_22455 [Acidimicrobiales bacterium]
MSTIVTLAKRTAISAVAVCTVVCGTTAIATDAGAATPSTPGAHAFAQAERRANCGNAEKQVTRVQRLEARFAAGIAKLQRHESKAQQAHDAHMTQAHDAHMTVYWKKFIAKRQKYEDWVLNRRVLAHQAFVDRVFSAKCHVTAPPVPSSPPTIAPPALSTPPTTTS